jgi:hypothetical protein
MEWKYHRYGFGGSMCVWVYDRFIWVVVFALLAIATSTSIGCLHVKLFFSLAD